MLKDSQVDLCGRTDFTRTAPLPVSYTHLDVYKRQTVGSGEIPIEPGDSWFSPK